MIVWVVTGEAEFCDGGTVRTFASESNGVFSSLDLAWEATHSMTWRPERHHRKQIDGNAWCSECHWEADAVEIDAQMPATMAAKPE